MILIALLAVIDGLTLYFAYKEITALKERVTALEAPNANEKESEA